ncbi:ATP-grasp fold amidoligase family protein, partial [Halobacterium salinarum]
EEYVIKPTHMSGSVVIVNEFETPNEEEIIKKCNEWLRETHGVPKEEYWYESIEPRILVEERLRDDKQEVPLDYKFFVFHGQVEYIEVDFTRFSHHKRRFYDRDWNPKEFTMKSPLGPTIEEPQRLDRMMEIAEKLGEGFDFIRIDLYELNGGRIVFGEMTVGPESGTGRFIPKERDFEFGSYW